MTGILSNVDKIDSMSTAMLRDIDYVQLINRVNNTTVGV